MIGWWIRRHCRIPRTSASRLQADLVIVAHRPNPASHKEEKKDYYIYRAHNSRWPVRLLELSDPIQSVLLLLFPLVITSAAVLPIIAWPHLSSNDIITLYVYIYTYRVAVGYTWPFFFARIRYATLTGSTASLIIQQQRRIDFARYGPLATTFRTLFRSYKSRKWRRKPQRPIPEDDFIFYFKKISSSSALWSRRQW